MESNTNAKSDKRKQFTRNIILSISTLQKKKKKILLFTVQYFYLFIRLYSRLLFCIVAHITAHVL